jgi:beta-glucosidase
MLEMSTWTDLHQGDWAEPWDKSDPTDVAAVQRKQEFFIGWFGDPVYFGDYPASMRAQLGDRLPSFTEEESELVKGSNDFYGMNHYCADYVKHIKGVPALDDILGNSELLKVNKEGQSIGPETQSTWLTPHPPGFRKLLNWISNRYGRPAIYVTENGTSLKGENDLPVDQLLEDDFRVRFFETYIGAMADAYTQDKIDVRGYMAWSLLE